MAGCSRSWLFVAYAELLSPDEASPAYLVLKYAAWLQ